MYEYDTIRLFGVANILKNKKDKNDNWERDDIPDIKEQSLTGKYDHNFDALGSDFQRAHQYNINNIDQPENTKTEVNYDTDKYTRFLNYTPSRYVQLEEEEYKPIGKYNEKADEYYIDNLKGKTLDDMIVGKMKENADAMDLPKDAARRQFAENIVGNASRFEDLPEYFEEVSNTPKLNGKARRNKDDPLQDYTMPEKIIIEKPIKIDKNGKKPIKTINTTINMDGLGAHRTGKQKNIEDNEVSNRAEEKVNDYFADKKDNALAKLYRNKEKKQHIKRDNAFLDEYSKGNALKRAFNKLRPEKYVAESTVENKPTPIEAVQQLIAMKDSNPKEFKQRLKSLEQFQQNNPKEFKRQFTSMARQMPEEFKLMLQYFKNHQQEQQKQALVKSSSRTKMNTLGKILNEKDKGLKKVAFAKLKTNQGQPSKAKTSTEKQIQGNPEAALKLFEMFMETGGGGAKKASPSGKSDKTDVASYMGGSEPDLGEIKAKKGMAVGTQQGRENYQQQQLEKGRPKYEFSLEVIKKNYPNAEAELTYDVKKEINDKIGTSFFRIKDKITAKEAISRLNSEIQRRTFKEGAALTTEALSKHNNA